MNISAYQKKYTYKREENVYEFVSLPEGNTYRIMFPYLFRCIRCKR